VAPVYAPSRLEISQAAARARLSNQHPHAKDRLLDKLDADPGDWDSRTVATPPGVLWSVASDTCMTGRPIAPRNVAYDVDGREFVYRQPTDEAELAAIMSADSEEVFACYRFDGLERWTRSSAGSWFDTTYPVVVAWVQQTLASSPDPEIAESLTDCVDYLTGPEFRSYMNGLVAVLPETLSVARRADPGVPRARWRRRRNE
jgi:hypothetical protein